MPIHWLQKISANAPERKLALFIATIATIAVTGSLIWSLFSEVPQAVVSTPRLPSAVQTIEKPSSIPVQSKKTVPAIKAIADTRAETTTNSKPLPAIQPTLSKKVTSVTKPSKKKVIIGQGNLYVQVGAFKQSNLARLMYEKMTRKYKRAKIILRSNLYLVWVGPVVTKKEASALKGNIQRQENIKGFVVSDK